MQPSCFVVAMRYTIALGLALTLPSLAVARDHDEALRFYLAKSDVVVLGEFASEPSREGASKFGTHHQADFKIAQLLKWDVPGDTKAGATIKVHIVRAIRHEGDFEPEDQLPELKKGGKCILFLECHELKPAPSYITADTWFGVQRPDSWMAKSLARIVAEQAKRPLRVPAEKEIEQITADRVRPDVHFKDFKVDRADLLKILRDYHVIPKQDWKHGYSHVAGEDRTGTIRLRDGTKIEYMVRPAGLATLAFPDGRQLYLAREKSSILAWGGGDTESWHGVEIVSFRDFDDVQVKVNGKESKAFLVGLRPLRETVKEKEELERLRTEITSKLRMNSLSARILTKTTAEVVGLSVDTFMHHKNDFGHLWDPNRYTYCWSGWGAYNLNTYFLQTKTTTFVDSLGDREDYENYRESFREAVKKIAAQEGR